MRPVLWGGRGRALHQVAGGSGGAGGAARGSHGGGRGGGRHKAHAGLCAHRAADVRWFLRQARPAALMRCADMGACSMRDCLRRWVTWMLFPQRLHPIYSIYLFAAGLFTQCPSY